MLLIPQMRDAEVPPPRVFCQKSLDLLDNKGVDSFRGDKESVIDSSGKTYVFWRGGIEITRCGSKDRSSRSC